MAIEGLGEAVTGGMLARAVEPQAGESADESERTCLNCGAALTGPYCQPCGQKGHVHRSLRGFWPRPAAQRVPFRRQDLAHLADARLAARATDPPLYRRRAGTFVSPLALFLFSVFLMFAVFSTVGGPFRMGNERPRS